MAIKSFNPTTPGQRGMTTQDFSQITTKKPVRSLLIVKNRGNGRNNQGRITTRHQGGGARQFYRLVDFNLAPGTTATIEHIEYDPNRSARIARIKDGAGRYSYIIAANGMRVGQKIKSGEESPHSMGYGGRNARHCNAPQSCATLRVGNNDNHAAQAAERPPFNVLPRNAVSRLIAVRSATLGCARHSSICSLRFSPYRHQVQKCSQLLVRTR